MLRSAKMLSKSRNFSFNLCLLRSRNEMVYAFLSNSFCTTTTTTMPAPKNLDNSPTMPESPQLPTRDNFPQTKGSQPDDDFVLPSVSCWVENFDKSYDVKRVVSKKAESDFDKISKIVKNNQPFESPEAVVQALAGCNVCVSESLVHQLLKRFSTDWVLVCGLFSWGKLKMGDCKFPRYVYDLVVHCLGKTRKFDLMWDVVEEMGRLGGRYVTLATMALVMRRLAEVGKYDEAIDAFRGVEKFGIKKDVVALNMIVDVLVKEGSVDRAQDICLELGSQIPPNLQTFNILIHGWSKANDVHKARDIMEEMEKHGVSPNAVSYTSLIEYYCHEKDIRRVNEILEEMKEKECLPNLGTYTSVMHALGKAGEIDNALKVYQTMKENGCAPNIAFCTYLIYYLNKSGRSKDAYQVFEDMPRQGISHNTNLYNVMIAGACQLRDEEKAFYLLQQMEQNQYKPDCFTYAPLLKLCCKLKRIKLIYFLMRHMLKNDVAADIGTYTTVVFGLCKSGKLEHACLFFEEAVSKGFVPWDTCYRYLVKSLEAKSMSKEKQRIEKLMLQAQQNEPAHPSEKLVKIQELE